MSSPTASVSGSEKANLVRSMFAQIAPKYDFLNHALSLNADRRWRRLVVSAVSDCLARNDSKALDLCCGTADLSIELARMAETIGVDFCQPMLQIGAKKATKSRFPVLLVEGDALRVPFASDSFEVVTIAFGLRNLESVEAGLAEIFRLLKPNGRAAILEFSHPRLPVFKTVFQFYFNRILPRIGNAVSGSGFAYRYLPDSVGRFPDQRTLASMMEAAGFSGVSYRDLFGGVAALHLGEKQ